MAVTEFGRMGVKPNHQVMDDTTPEGKILKDTYEGIAKMPTGPYRLYWGLEIEDPSKLWGFMDWDNVEHHEKFVKEFGAEAVKDLPKILTHGEFTKHVTPTPFPALALQAPVTGLILAYFKPDVSSALKEAATSNLQLFIKNAVEKSPDAQGISHGWSVESDIPIIGGKEGDRGAVLTAFIGWPDMDAQKRFLESEEYKENEKLLTGMEELVKLTTVHVELRNAERKLDE